MDITKKSLEGLGYYHKRGTNIQKAIDKLVANGEICKICFSDDAGTTYSDNIKVCHTCEIERLENS
jgi:hypothetical protein